MVYSDIFWYGDMILPVWAKNQKFSKFHVQYIWKIVRAWRHQLAHLNIHKDWSRNVSWKNVKFQNVITPLFLIRFSSFFALFCREYFSLSFKFFKILVWSSSLRIHFKENKRYTWYIRTMLEINSWELLIYCQFFTVLKRCYFKNKDW